MHIGFIFVHRSFGGHLSLGNPASSPPNLHRQRLRRKQSSAIKDQLLYSLHHPPPFGQTYLRSARAGKGENRTGNRHTRAVRVDVIISSGIWVIWWYSDDSNSVHTDGLGVEYIRLLVIEVVVAIVSSQAASTAPGTTPGLSGEESFPVCTFVEAAETGRPVTPSSSAISVTKPISGSFGSLGCGVCEMYEGALAAVWLRD